MARDRGQSGGKEEKKKLGVCHTVALHQPYSFSIYSSFFSLLTFIAVLSVFLSLFISSIPLFDCSSLMILPVHCGVRHGVAGKGLQHHRCVQ